MSCGWEGFEGDEDHRVEEGYGSTEGTFVHYLCPKCKAANLHMSSLFDKLPFNEDQIAFLREVSMQMKEGSPAAFDKGVENYRKGRKVHLLRGKN